MPADQLIPTMRFMRDSLGGVACGFCHLQDRSVDDKPEKKMARKMIAMEVAINKDTFGGSRRGHLLHLPAAARPCPLIPHVISDLTIASAAAPPDESGSSCRTHGRPDPGEVY